MRLVGILLIVLGLLFIAALILPCRPDSWIMPCERDGSYLEEDGR